MSKRELGLSNGALAVEGPRIKRRKETAATTSDLDVSMSDPIAPGAEQNGQAGGEGDDVVKEQGLKLWQIVKDAMNKECVACCLISTSTPATYSSAF
jgi:chromatin structure-remodeling complex subunit RSC4